MGLSDRPIVSAGKVLRDRPIGQEVLRDLPIGRNVFARSTERAGMGLRHGPIVQVNHSAGRFLKAIKFIEDNFSVSP